MQIQDIMSTYVHSIGIGESASAAARKMREADVGCLVVSEDGPVRGIITDRDLAIGCLAGGHDPEKCHLSSHMSSPVVTAPPGMDILDAAHMMSERKIRRLPVVDGDKIIGLVSLSDIALAIDKAMQSMDQAMHDLLVGMGASRSA